MTLFPRGVLALLLAGILGDAQALGADDIHAAVRRNDLAAVRTIVAANPAALKDQSSSQSPLHEAACYVSPEMVKLLIELGADVNATAYNRFTPLHVVKDAESAKALIKAGADLTKVDSWGKTPLQGASPEIAEAMIAAGAKVDLATAIRLKKRDLVKKILAEDPAAASPKGDDSDLWGSTSPLGIAAGQGDLEIVQLLVAAGAPIDQGTSMPNAGGDATALTNAVWAGHTEVVRFLLDKGASTNTTGGKFYDSLFDYAVKHSKPEIVELLITHGAAKPGLTSRNTSPLATAASRGKVKIIELLLKHEAASFTAEDLRRALFLAALARRDDVTKLLLSQGAVADVFVSAVMGDTGAVEKELDRDPTLVNAHDKVIGRSILAWSIRADRESMVRLLLERKANVKETSSGPLMQSQLFELATPPANAGTTRYAMETETPMSIAIGEEGRRGASAQIVLLLLEHGADANVEGGVMGMSTLANAVHLNNIDAVKGLIEHKADVNAKDRFGSPVLIYAIDSPEIAKFLLDAGADASATDHQGRSMLEAALDWPSPAVAELLTAHGAKLTLRAACMLGKTDFVLEAVKADPAALGPFAGSQFKETPLLLAAANGRSETVRALLDTGAKLDYADLQGCTALHKAAESGDVATIALLLERGASIVVNGNYGTPLQCAAGKGRLEAVKFLLDRKAPVDLESHPGLTPLDWCAYKGSGEVAEVLIAHGASVSHKGRISGGTPLHTAASSGNVSVARALLKGGADPKATDSRGRTPLDQAVESAKLVDREDAAGVNAVIELLGGSAK